MPRENRVYKKGAAGSEYDSYHGKPEQIANRAARNKARAEAVKDGKVHKGDGREIDHLKPLDKGGSNSKKNTRVVSRTENRKKYNKGG
jgi:hypothetical protein